MSDLTWSSATNGWGPVERDRSNAEQAAGDGTPLTVNGTVYAKGLGTHAASSVAYYLGGSCSSLTTAVGVDDEVTTKGSVVFQVWRDSSLVADSGKMTSADPAKQLSVDLTGALDVRLVVTDAGDGVDYDHGDWGGPRLVCA
ncbi:NPCBM/NEW2 domain-containing protein [Streptomyces sp. NBC_00224]|uniref:NPCBM/NEW2 domain-containing protein n=1 Tax=Streptomyces sp. NBC_00060 TaxID=2975636 RepID=A0AAU2HEB8_9ACTN